MNRRLRTLTWSLSLLLLAARPTRAADGLAYVGTQHDGNAGDNETTDDGENFQHGLRLRFRRSQIGNIEK